jgi:hypothetical protein
MTSYFTGAKPEEEKNDKLYGNILFNTLTQFIYHFTNFGMSIANGHKIINYFSEKYNLDENRHRVLISEFEAT